MNWLRNFMYGRYGTDQLSYALIGLYFILSIIAGFSRRTVFMFIAYIPIIYFFFRTFSRNIYKRQEENYKFLQFWNPIKSKIMQQVNLIKGSKTHKYFKCPNCKQTVRVPRGKGKIRITCPKCRTEFVKRT